MRSDLNVFYIQHLIRNTHAAHVKLFINAIFVARVSFESEQYHNITINLGIEYIENTSLTNTYDINGLEEM